MKGIARALLVMCAALLAAPPARAHEVRPAYLQIEESAPDRFEVLWKQPSAGMLALHLAPKLSNGLLDGLANDEYAADNFVIRRWNGLSMPRDTFDGAILRIEGLENTITDVLVNVTFLNGQQIQSLLEPSAPELTLHLSGTGKLSVPAYLSLGIEHILTGFDHLSFVLGLVLLVRGRMRLLGTISAFTLAHSITLAVAALDYVQMNPPLIESLVALSIVFVAVELARSLRGHDGLTIRYPWMIAFTFGLLHGFAFAGSLADIGLPPNNIPAALLLFNCGVEIGQLLFVSAVLTLMAILGRFIRPGTAVLGRWATVYAIGTLASYWMIERLNVLSG